MPHLTGSKDSPAASFWKREGFPRQSARCEQGLADVQEKMGKGTNVNQNETTRTFTWDEVHKHTSKEDRWIVIDGNVYDITRFQKRHPGGAKIIGHFAGEDATVSRNFPCNFCRNERRPSPKIIIRNIHNLSFHF